MSSTPPESSAAEDTRRRLLRQASDAADAFLRSPAFLQTLKTQIDAVVQAQRATPGRGAALFANPIFSQTQANFRRGATAHEIVYESPMLRLRHYRSRSGRRFVEPILICYALVNRPYILDLAPQRSVIERLAQHFDVYLIDWGAPTPADHTRGLADYVCDALHRAVDAAGRRADSRRLHLLGYCMGGTLATMYAALFPQRIRSLILMAAPIDFARGRGLLNLWAQREYFDVDALVDAFGNCPGEFLQYCFQLLRPVQNFHEKYMTLVEKLNDEQYLVNFLAIERWTSDQIPVAGETFRQFVKQLYQRNLLARGGFFLAGRRVDLAEIACPLLLLTADFDHLAPPPSTLALAELTSSRDINTLSCDVGHVGLAVSRKAQGQLWPAVCRWIERRSSAPTSREDARGGDGPGRANVSQAESNRQRSATMSENNNPLDALRRSAFFNNVSDEHLAPLAEIARLVDFPARKTIFAEFETAKDVFVIVSGEVSVVVCEPNVGCRQLATVGAGELLGWSPLLEQRRLTATAVTLAPTKAIVIDGHALAELCRKDPQLGYEFMSRTAQVLADRLHASRVQLLETAGLHLPEVALESD